MTMDFVGQAAHSCRSHYVEAAWCGCWGQNNSDVVYFPLKSRIIKNHTHLPGSNLRVFMYVNGFSSLSTANATCAEVRAASSMLYTTFNPPLRILSVITLRIMPAFPLSLSLQQQCHIGWLAIWPSTAASSVKNALSDRKGAKLVEQWWTTSFCNRDVSEGENKKLGYIYSEVGDMTPKCIRSFLKRF